MALLLRQKRAAIQEQALQSYSVSVPGGNARKEHQGCNAPAVMQQIDSLETTRMDGGSHPEQPETVVFADPAIGVAVQPNEVADRVLTAEDLVGCRAGLGDQGDGGAVVSGDGTNMRQVPDHVANAWQLLHHGDSHERRVRQRASAIPQPTNRKNHPANGMELNPLVDWIGQS